MLPFEDRHARQRQLAEVGTAGQHKLTQAHVVIGDHAGAELEREYLLRAGVGCVVISKAAQPAPFPLAEHFEFGAARTLAQAAWGALDNIRKVLGVSVQ